MPVSVFHETSGSVQPNPRRRLFRRWSLPPDATCAPVVAPQCCCAAIAIMATATALTALAQSAGAACERLDNATKPADVGATPMRSDNAVIVQTERK